eukprot:CAMPEP_0119280730 /NCGR_PEP_ID=MMETSP1329-20130426/23293_1 /TAXON_ID=114041 /ORGANISM="Genus nov. species nov., Strain RCC1024" /LENGTH=225 /DNA_ID=CAMNT_0007281327 /DNA_START=95 /DNA_END=769 /DNA_ORIENTATION=-
MRASSSAYMWRSSAAATLPDTGAGPVLARRRRDVAGRKRDAGLGRAEGPADVDHRAPLEEETPRRLVLLAAAEPEDRDEARRQELNDRGEDERLDLLAVLGIRLEHRGPPAGDHAPSIEEALESVVEQPYFSSNAAPAETVPAHAAQALGAVTEPGKVDEVQPRARPRRPVPCPARSATPSRVLLSSFSTDLDIIHEPSTSFSLASTNSEAICSSRASCNWSAAR